jgi:hypothetical protein
VTAVECFTDWLGNSKLGPLDAAPALAILYFLFQAVSLALIAYVSGAGVGIDDAEQLIYLPHLQAGYGGSQPPVYNWITWLAAQVGGTNVFTLKAVKYAMLIVAAASVYAALRRLGYSQPAASAGLLSLLVIQQVFWAAQSGLSHTLAAIAFTALSFWAMVNLIKQPKPISYVVFGLAAAAAILAKYNCALFIAGLLAAALSIREGRQALLTRSFALSLAVALAAMMPTLLWNIENLDALLARTNKFDMQAADSALPGGVVSLLEFMRACLSFVALPAIVFAIGALAARTLPRDWRHAASDSDRLLWRTVGFGALFSLILILAAGVTTLRERWMLPVLLMMPVAMAVWTDGMKRGGAQVRKVVMIAGVACAIGVMPVLWYIHLAGGMGLGRSGRLDYPALYQEIQSAADVRTVVSDQSWIGNFRLLDPDMTLLTDEVPHFIEQIEGPAVLIWLDEKAPRGNVTDLLLEAGYKLGDVRSLDVPMRFGKTRVVSFARLERE